MTASVQYWRLPEEEADMIEYLRSLGSVMAMPVRTVANVEQLVWRSVEEALREPDPTFLITPQKFVADMKLFSDEKGVAPNVVSTPALFYSRGQLVEGKTLYSTSLSVEWDDKPAEFVRWGRKVMQWVRKAAPGWYRYKHHRITTKADAARAAGMEMEF